MKVAMLVLSAVNLWVLLVAGSCATWYFTLPADAPGQDVAGGGMMVAFVGLPLVLLGIALGAIAGILAAVSATQRRRRAWRLAAITGVLLGGAVPIVLLVSILAISLNAPPDAVVNGPPVVTSVSLLIFALPVAMPLITLAYAATMKVPPRPPANAFHPPVPYSYPYDAGSPPYGPPGPFPPAPQVPPPGAPPASGPRAPATPSGDTPSATGG